MLTCRKISLEEDLEWDELIKESQTATFFQDKEWLQLWVKHWSKDGEVVIYAVNKKLKIEHIREKELLKSAKILGIKKVEFLDFIDGTLCNAVYHDLAVKIIKKIKEFRPQVIVTPERRGVSGHLDHIAVSMITTFAHLKTKLANKLYYHCLPKEMRDKRMEEYFIYFPEGYSQDEITTRIDYSSFWDEKVKAMLAHQSQIKDVKDLLARFQKWPKVDHFILQYYHGVKVKLPETDLFAGISS